MTEIIGKTLQQIIDLQPNLDDLTWREVCYVVALGMGEAEVNKSEIFQLSGANKIHTSGQFPKYHESWEHAGRVFDSLPFSREYDDDKNVYYFWPEGSPLADAWGGILSDLLDSKECITKAAAKCILSGIELEVDGE